LEERCVLAAPNLAALDLTPTSLVEANAVTLRGTFTDPDPGQQYSLIINWGDNTPTQVVSLGTAKQFGPIPHTYQDDGPSAAPSDKYAVNVTVIDTGLEGASRSAEVTVANQPPRLDTLTPTPVVNENGVATLQGTFTDPGTLDAHTVVINWGDGSAPTTHAVTPGARTFSATHQYPDDNPTGTPQDPYALQVTLHDDDGGSDTKAASLAVNNVAPAVAPADLGLSAAAVNEMGTVTLTGRFTDPGTQDTHTAVIDWGDGSTKTTLVLGGGLRTFSATHQYFDDNPTGSAQDSNRITVTVTDDDGSSGSAGIDVTLRNTAPALAAADLGLSAATIDEGGTVTLTGRFTDAGMQDGHTAVIDWGDGSAKTTLPMNGGLRTFSAAHQYLDAPPGSSPGSYPITVTVTDDDTGSATAAASVAVRNVAPGLSGVQVTQPLLENGLATLTGTITDQGNDSYTLIVTWGDGAPEVHNLPAGTRSFSLTHRYLDDDPTTTPADQYIINLVLIDGDGVSAATTTAVVANVAPAVADLSLSANTIDENGTTTLSGVFTDPGSRDVHTVLIDWGDGSAPTILTLTVGARAFTAAHQYRDDDPSGTSTDVYPITVTVLDDDGGSGSAGIDLTVRNVAPALDSEELTLSKSTVNEGDTTTLSGAFTDPGTLDSHRVVISWGDGSPDLVLDLGPGVFTFSAAHRYTDDNPTDTAQDLNTITVTVLDDDGGSASADKMITVRNVGPDLFDIRLARDVNGQPEFPDEGPLILTEGERLFFLATLTDPGTADTYLLQINWGDGSTQTFPLSSVFNGQELTLLHTYQNNPAGSPTGSFRIDYFIFDDDGDADGGLASVAVHNTAPDFDSGDLRLNATVIDEGTPLILNGSFFDGGEQDTHTVVINWGDGSAPTTLQLAAGVDDFSATRSGLNDRPGGAPYQITVTVTDQDGAAHSATRNVTVRNVLPLIADDDLHLAAPQTQEGDTVALSGTFADPGTGETHTVVIDWGDGSADTTLTLAASARSFGATHRYLANNPDGTPFEITVTVADNLGASTARTSALVVNAPPSVEDGDLNLDTPVLHEDGTVTLSGAFTDPGTGDAHTVVIKWGDGSPDTTLTLAPGATTFSAPHRYLDDGAYPLSVTVSDGSASATAGAGVTVLNRPPAAAGLNLSAGVITESDTVTLDGAFADPGSLDSHTVVIDWGDGSAPTTLALGPGVGTFRATHQYLDNSPAGGHAILVTVTDDGGASAASSTAVTVANAAPVVSGLDLGAGVVNENETITLHGALTDPGSDDAHTVVINWGDGSPETTHLLAPLELTFSVTHSYLDNGAAGNPSGRYTITVTVLDDDGGSSSAPAAVTVHNVAPVLQAADLHLSAGTVFENGSVSLSGAFADAGTLDLHTVIVSWGDGSPITALSLAPGVFAFGPFSHAYARAGNYTVTVTVLDKDNGIISAEVAVSVVPLGLALGGAGSVTPGVPYTLILASTTPNAPPLTSWTITWGDGSVETVPGSTTSLTHTYGFDPGAYTISATAVVGANTFAAGNVLLVRVQSGNPQQDFVAQLYLDLLKRPADAGGLASWTDLLAQGGSRTQVVQGILASVEYRTNLVQELYGALLGRAADPEGLANAVEFLGAGGAVAQLKAAMLGSPEYYAVRGQNSAPGFLRAVYQDLLGRPVDPAGESSLLLLLARGFARSDVAGMVLGSVEAQQGLVGSFYQRYLRRLADPAGLNSLVEALQRGARDDQVLTLMLSADEYFARL
jgi:hypothetical protein